MDSKWSTIGDGGDQSAFGYSDVTVNRISVSNLEELWQQQFKVDFPECNKNEQVRFSRGDHKLIEMLRDSLKLVDGQYSIGLPLKKKNVYMPDNRTIAEQRALNLNKRLEKDV